MDFYNELKELGVNVDEALNRFRGNSAIFDKMIAKFPKAAADCDAMSAFEDGNYEAALEKTHTLKGITGNLSLTPLFKGYSEIVRLIRAGENDEAFDMYIKLMPIQNEITACIEKNFTK